MKLRNAALSKKLMC